jgi:hypothetical protein
VNCRKEGFCSAFFCGKDLVQRILIKKCLLFTVDYVCGLKRFTTGSRNSLGHSKVADDALQGAGVTDTTVKRPYAAGFDSPVKRWDNCIIVDGGHVEK